jgi:hypothetical protein
MAVLWGYLTALNCSYQAVSPDYFDGDATARDCLAKRWKSPSWRKGLYRAICYLSKNSFYDGSQTPNVGGMFPSGSKCYDRAISLFTFLRIERVGLDMAEGAGVDDSVRRRDRHRQE